MLSKNINGQINSKNKMKINSNSNSSSNSSFKMIKLK